MIITNFRIFESKDLYDKIDMLYIEYKKADKEEKEKVLRKISKEASNSGNIRPWFEKFRKERPVMVELKRKKM